MQHLEVTFRMETPLYLAGADQSKAELRVPSIKGALRYWYRAIQPNLAAEGQLFGSMQDGHSPLRLHLEKLKTPEPIQNTGFIRDKSESTYLAFSLKERAYYPSTTTLQLHLHVHRESSSWKDYLASIWLLSAIGGLGSRSRRGYGSFSWIDSQSCQDEIKELLELLPKLSTVQTIEQWTQQFNQGIKTLWEWFPEERSVTHTIINPEMKFYLSKVTFSNWHEAMKTGAAVLKNFRQQEGKKSFEEAPETEIRKSIGGAKEKERYPSPYWLRIVRIADKYLPIYFLPKTKLPNLHFATGLEMFGAYLCENGFRLEELHS